MHKSCLLSTFKYLKVWTSDKKTRFSNCFSFSAAFQIYKKDIDISIFKRQVLSVQKKILISKTKLFTVQTELIFLLFVTSKNQITNSPINEFKVLHTGQRAFENPYLMEYYFLFITLKERYFKACFFILKALTDI